MSRLSLYLLGPPRIECAGRPIQVETRKAVALLVYIAVTGERHLRDALVALLWPESDQSRGRTALRSTLYALRKALAVPSAGSGQAPSTGSGQVPSPGPGQVDWLDVDREDVGLNPDVDVWLDVEQFHRHLDECHTHGHPPSEVCPACLAPLTAAAALYRGDFLSGFTLKDSFNFDDWQFFQTESLQREFAGALDRLVRCHIAQAAFEPAIRYARQWLALDRLNESAHCQLMLLYAWSGQRPAALRQYQECVRILESQLGVAPQAPTTALYQAIAAGRTPAPPASLAEKRLPIAAPAPLPVEEARHLVTALVADVSRSFTAGSGIGPEDEASLVERFLGVMQATVTRHGGQVERTWGGSVLAVFGATQTHESDPELAVRAALEVRQEVEALGLSMAASVDTGEVYLKVGGPGREAERTLVGRAIDRAVRLAGQAQAGQILAGESTYHLTRRTFAFTPGTPDATGRDGPRVYRVEHLLLQARKTRGIEGLRAELVGRDGELARLKTAFAQVLQGQGHVVFLTGEAGVGKSRLVAELSQVTVAPTGEDGRVPLWLEGRCLELGTTAAYAPFVDVLRQYFAWGAREAGRRRYERVTSSLQGLVEGGSLAQERADEIAALLGRLLSLPIGDEWEERLRNDDPQQGRWRTFRAVRDFVFALCQSQPLVLVFEDLHWADSLSVDLIALLMEGLPRAPLLLLCVYRPEREQRCSHLPTIAAQKCRGRYTELTLRELDHEQSQHMVESLLTKALPLSVREWILGQSQGNPFLIEEVVRSLIDAGSIYREGDIWRAREDVGLATMPESVQGIILSRVDHLEQGWRHVLQVASAIGRVFRQRVLALALGQETGLERALWELEERALVYQERTVPEVEYSFKHVLTQQAVYQNMPQRQRRSIHQQVAEALVTLYRESLDGYYEQLAYHYDQGGDTEHAVEYLLRAGEKARRRYANEEAIALLNRGLELLRSLPESPERDRRELDLLVALGVPLVHAKGHMAPEMERTYARARALSEQIGDARQGFDALVGLRRFYLSREGPKAAYELGERLLTLAHSIGDPLQLSWAHAMQAETLYFGGEFAQAREHCEEGLVFYDPQRGRAGVSLYGNDAGSLCRLFRALALWHLGYPDQAIRGADEGLALAQELSHPFALAFTLYLSALVRQLCRQVQVVQERADAVLRISAERGFPIYLGLGTAQRGWALAAQGQQDEGLRQMEEGVVAVPFFGGTVRSHMLVFLAEAYGQAGQVEGALSLLDEALSRADATGGRYWQAEQYRLKGETLLKKGEEAEAEACFGQALAVARHQQARSWELRAATSLARLWQRQGKQKEARELLANVYGWFTEGFGTADLQEARALLEATRD